MPIISKSLTDAIKQLLQSLQIAYLFPAAIFTLSTYALFSRMLTLDPTTSAASLLGVTVVLSYLLYACNIPIIRLAEGYTLGDSWFFAAARWIENRRQSSLARQVDECDKKLAEVELLKSKLYLCNMLTPEMADRLDEICNRWLERKRPIQAQLELRFPAAPRKPLATALGNTVAAFEGYPKTRYNIDAVHLWPRLLPVLEEKKFLPFVQSEKTILDFLLNIVMVLMGIVIELLFLFGLYRPSPWYMCGVLVLLVTSYVLYRGAVIAAEHWGGMVRVAFDLYRDDLRRALYLPPLPNRQLAQERAIWGAVSRFIVFGDEDGFEGFVYPNPTLSEK